MARNLHKSLGYEKRLLGKKMYQIRVLSDLLYELDTVFNRTRLEQAIWTWEGGMVFTNLKKEEFKKVKLILKKFGLSKLQKLHEEDQIKLEGSIAEKFLRSRYGDIKVRVSIEFTWALPDSCTVIYNTTLKKVDSDRFQMLDGELHEEVITTEIDCKKPVLSAVFGAAIS